MSGDPVKSSPGPLAGLRVVEFDAIGPVTLAAMILADLGCDVVRVARPMGAGQVFDGVGGSVLHRNRPVVRLDLKNPADRDRALDLVAGAEAVIEGLRPGVMERLGLGPEPCLSRNPALAYVRVTGWGQDGPLAKSAGHDLNYIGLTGVLHALGEADRPPPPPLNLIGDYGGGAMFAVTGLLSAVIAARATGRGQVVDVAMTDGTAVLGALFHALRAEGVWSGARGSNLLDGGAPFYRCYGCADGGFVAVAALEPPFFAALLQGLGLPAGEIAQYDRAAWPAMAERFAGIFVTRTRDDWADAFAGMEACVTPVLDFGEAATHPQATARAAYEDLDGVVHPLPAPRFSATPLGVALERKAELVVEDVLARWR